MKKQVTWIIFIAIFLNSLTVFAAETGPTTITRIQISGTPASFVIWTAGVPDANCRDGQEAVSKFYIPSTDPRYKEIMAFGLTAFSNGYKVTVFYNSSRLDCTITGISLTK